jgi:hypothetical protein
MNTPSHILWGAAAFARAGNRKVVIAALAGGLAPDISLYVMAVWALFVQGIPPETVFGEYYFSKEWMGVFSYDNSLVLWGIVLLWAVWAKQARVVAFAGAGMLHLVTDFLLHHSDARPHFWPLTDWIFTSPVSYWNPAFYGRIIAPVEMAADLVCCVVLWRRFPGRRVRALLAVVALVPVAILVAMAARFFTG